MRAFIIRPFGTKEGIDFEAVERQLINPALDRFSISGRTTMEIARQGNIRVDMFQRLLTADLVIADVSVHNANVFYELGIRHALRDKRTFLIRCKRDDLPDVPFDLKTDRYMSYPRDNPAECLAALIEGLRQTINSEAADSPVFQLLPDLQVQDRSRFLPVPLDFREEVERAAEARQAGDLELLAAEMKGFEWEIEGLRCAGRAQYNLKAFEGARATLESIRNLDLRDLEANTLLGTVYQRLGDLPRSDQALKRALAFKGLGKGDRAEIHSLLGRNAKTRWRDEWKNAPAERRREQALNSPILEESFEAYAGAFSEDLNHFYSGLNALSLLTIMIELADAMPGAWAARFDEDEEAERELEKRKEQRQKLAAAIELSLEAALVRLKREGTTDIWAEISEADLCFLVAKLPTRVATAYRNALAGAPDFATDAARGQIALYQQLEVLKDNVAAALSAMSAPEPASAEPVAGAAPKPKRVLLFTGHMVDAPGRTKPRFPPDKVDKAKEKIREAVLSEQAKSSGIGYGIAGCASGGDILFHQICEELDIPTQIYLALPREQYIRSSVAHGGPDWVEEFNRLYKSRPVRVLAESKELPRWLQDKPDYSVWQRNNLWTLHNALAAAGGDNVTLIALWDGAAGDGPGGTGDMVQKARERGAKTIILAPKAL